LCIGWPADLTAYKLLTDWGSFIGGVFALLAGAALYVAGRQQVKATREAASKEIAATKDAIAAAQEQTRVAQEQIDVTLRLERRRIARESYAFLAMLSAAMTSIMEDVAEARAKFAGEPDNTQSSQIAYEARQRVKKTGFADVRSACVRLGSGLLTTDFLRLDKEIDDFAAKWTLRPTAGDPVRVGSNANLRSQLDIINAQATALLDTASEELKRCSAVLAETPGLGDFP
jgi:hypothetical protein